MKRWGLMCVVFMSMLGFGQDHTLFSKAPEDWREEVIPFPLGFAPEIDLKGVEELRFSPNAFNPEVDNFFTYAFVWSLDGKVLLDEATLETYLLAYYVGLYKAVSKAEKKEVDQFKVDISAAQDGFYKGAEKSYKGSIHWREPFATEAAQTLHYLVDRWQCPEQRKTFYLFLVSPKTEPHALWDTLKSLEIQACSTFKK